MQKDFDYYLDRYQYGRSLTQNVDYGSRRSVADNDRGTDIYRGAAKAIGSLFPERIKDFAVMLSDEDRSYRLDCAVCILTLMDAEAKIREKALSVIKDAAANGSSFDRCVWSMWLKKNGFE